MRPEARSPTKVLCRFTSAPVWYFLSRLLPLPVRGPYPTNYKCSETDVRSPDGNAKERLHGDPMIVDGPDPEPSSSHDDIANVSTHNNADSQYRGNKRPNDHITGMTDSVQPKRGKHSQTSSQKSHSPPPTGLDEAESPSRSYYHIGESDDIHQPEAKLVKDLQTRALTVFQLIQEVKGIYAGLGEHGSPAYQQLG